jgi:proline dehydrogenase
LSSGKELTIIRRFTLFLRLTMLHSMNNTPVISFDNTENAFAYKSNKELKKAKFLFSSMRYEALVKLGIFVTPGYP